MSDRRRLSFLLSLTLFSILQGDTVGTFEPCPGQYCGRIINDDGKTGDCGACPRGYNTNGTVCLECSSSPDLYDWLYLGFMAFLSLVIHWFFIDLFAKRDRKSIFFLCLSAFVESTSAAIFSLLASKPQGSLSLTSCKAKQIADWYTIFFNPKPDYVNTIHCTQEAVYPLYTIVLMYYALSVGLLVLLRPIVSHQFCDGQGRNSIYAAMYFLPCLAVLHALFGGLIFNAPTTYNLGSLSEMIQNEPTVLVTQFSINFGVCFVLGFFHITAWVAFGDYSYPYITLTISILSTAAVLAKNKITHIGQMVKSKRYAIIIMAHWLAHAYGILAVTQLRDPTVHGPMFALVLAPVSFFLLTHSFTEPSKFKTP